MSICPKCNRPIVGRKSSHRCDLAVLSDGRQVHVSRIEKGGDLYQDVVDGKIIVEFRMINKIEKFAGRGKPNKKGGLTVEPARKD